MRLNFLGALLVTCTPSFGCGDSGGARQDEPGGECAPCDRTLDCGGALRCIGRLCVRADDPGACGEAPREDAEIPDQGDAGPSDSGPPVPVAGDSLTRISGDGLHEGTIEPVDAEILGDLLALCSNTRGLVTYDISDPERPQKLGAAGAGGGPMGSHCQHLAMAGEVAFAAHGGDSRTPIPSITTVAIPAAGRPEVLASLPLPGLPVSGLRTHGGLLVAAAHTAGLVVFDVSDPLLPVEVRRISGFTNAGKLDFDGDLAYVADGAGGLKVVSFEVPANPRLVGGIDLPGRAVDVVVADGLAYVALGASGAAIVDVGDPEAPRLVSTMQTSGTATAVALLDRHLVISDWDGMRLFDARDPEAPVFLTSDRPPMRPLTPGSTSAEGRTALLMLGVAARGDIVVALNWHGPQLFRFRADRQQGDLQVESRELLLFSTGPGDSRSRVVILANHGQLPVILRDVQIDGPEGLRAGPLPERIEPGERDFFELTFEDLEGLPEGGSLAKAVIRSDDPDEPELLVRLFLNPPGARVGDQVPAATLVTLAGEQIALRSTTSPYLLAYFSTF